MKDMLKYYTLVDLVRDPFNDDNLEYSNLLDIRTTGEVIISVPNLFSLFQGDVLSVLKEFLEPFIDKTKNGEPFLTKDNLSNLMLNKFDTSNFINSYIHSTLENLIIQIDLLSGKYNSHVTFVENSINKYLDPKLVILNNFIIDVTDGVLRVSGKSLNKYLYGLDIFYNSFCYSQEEFKNKIKDVKLTTAETKAVLLIHRTYIYHQDTCKINSNVTVEEVESIDSDPNTEYKPERPEIIEEQIKKLQDQLYESRQFYQWQELDLTKHSDVVCGIDIGRVNYLLKLLHDNKTIKWVNRKIYKSTISWDSKKNVFMINDLKRGISHELVTNILNDMLSDKGVWFQKI